MKLLFLAIQQYLLSVLTAFNITYIRVWNDQVQNLIDGKDETFSLPAIFIEFPDEIQWQQLGGGNQIVDPLLIKVHLLHEFYDAQDGTMGQNLAVLDMAESIFTSFQDWMPDTMVIGGVTYQIPVGSMVRLSDKQDMQHTNLYHFISTYQTTWVDSKMNRPVGGSLTTPPINYTLIVTPEWVSGNLYIVNDEVVYLGSAYRCILNTTMANEVPTNSTYWTLITVI